MENEIKPENLPTEMCNMETEQENFQFQSENEEIIAQFHNAAKEGQYEKLEAFLKKHPCASVVNEFGETAVMLAVESAGGNKPKRDESTALRCVQLLAEKGCDLNVRNNISYHYTAVHIAAYYGLWEIVQFLLGKNVNVDIKIDSTTARKLIEGHNPGWDSNSTYEGSKETGQDPREPLVTVLESLTESAEAKELHFDQWLEKNSKYLRVNVVYKGRYTLLECAVQNKLIGVVKKLVSRYECKIRIKTLDDAVKEGYEFFSALTSKNKNRLPVLGVLWSNKQTLLHRAIESPKADVKVVESLLHLATEQMSDNKITKKSFEEWVDKEDYRGFTAFYYAVKNQLKDVQSLLLKNGAGLFITDIFKVPVLSWIQPEVIEEFLDSRIKLTHAPREKTYSLVIDYNFLQQNNKKPNKNERNSTTGNEDENTSLIEIEDSQLNTETASLVLIATSPIHKHLLRHPAIKSFLYLKWHRLYLFFWINFALYFAFVASFTVLLLLSNEFDNGNNNDNSSRTQEEQAAMSDITERSSDIPRVVTIVFAILLAAREIWQLLILHKHYHDRKENLLEMAIVILMFVFLFFESFSTNKELYKALAAVLYLLVSLEMLLLTGRHPVCATYLNMFRKVSINSIGFLLWFASLIFGFSVAFYIIFHKCDGRDCEKNFFRSIPTSFFKTLVMLSSEYEAGGINFDQLSIYSHVIFFTFLFFISIVLVNLLNGLAVSDTQEIKNGAKLFFYISQAKYYDEIERTLLVHCENENLCRAVKVCAKWIGKHILLLGNLLPNNKITVLMNDNNTVKPDVKIFKNDCFLFCCCPIDKLPYFECKMCNAFNEIVEEALHVANKQHNQQDGNQDLVLSRIDQMEKVLGQITKKLK